MQKKYAQEARSLKHNLTNNTTPIKPAIAKALASKLSQKKKISEEGGLMAAQSNQSVPDQQAKDNTIIIYEVTQLTEDNMYDTNQLLNGGGGGGGGESMDYQVQQQHQVHQQQQQQQPTIVCNGTTETNMIVPHPGTSEVLVDVPKMIVLKKTKKGEPSAFRANEILNLDNGVIVRKDEPYNCEDCKKTFAKKYQLKRHQETHDSIFYICPYCDKPPLKARSSLKKHFTREHNDKIHEWNTSNFLSKQILRDEVKLRELRKKYHEKKRLNGDKLVEAIRAMNGPSSNTLADGDVTSTSDSLDSLVEDLDNNNVHHQNGFQYNNNNNITIPIATTTPNNNNNNNNNVLENNSKKNMHQISKSLKSIKTKKFIQNSNSSKLNRNSKITDFTTINHHHHHHHNHHQDDHEIENLFDNLINDNLLDPLTTNGNAYGDENDDDQMQTNFIQETFQNSFKEIQEKLDADFKVGSEQIKWEDNLKSDDSSDEIMSDKLLDESTDLMLI